jgi:hypothetical protein
MLTTGKGKKHNSFELAFEIATKTTKENRETIALS